MDDQSNRYDIDDTDYDGDHQKRWYYRLYSDGDGAWFWEPRVPSPEEEAAPNALGGVSWQPMILTEAEWPSVALRGPYTHRGLAIGAAEGWFDSLPPA